MPLKSLLEKSCCNFHYPALTSIRFIYLQEKNLFKGQQFNNAWFFIWMVWASIHWSWASFGMACSHAHTFCVLYKNTLSLDLVAKYWVLQDLEHFQFLRSAIKKFPSFYDVIGGQVRGPKFKNLFFHTRKYILGILSKEICHFFIVSFQIEIAVPPLLTS